MAVTILSIPQECLKKDCGGRTMPECLKCKHWEYCGGALEHENCYENAEDPQEVIKLMLAKFGEDSQIDVAIEEMSELIKELVKYKRSKIHSREKTIASREHVVEEIGDVMFMFEYLKTIFNIGDEEIKNTVCQKAKRTKERYIDGEE